MDSTRAAQVRAQHGPLYAALGLGWLLITIAAFAAVVHDDWERIEAEFLRHAEHEIVVLRDRLRGNEAVLDGLAAFLGSVEHPTHPQLAAFAERILRAHPDDRYTLGVVEQVSADARPAFEAALALRSGDDGRISRFDYAGGRTWGPVARKPYYFPLSFVWPETAETRPLLGLDFDSVPHLRAVMRSAEQRGASASSAPFERISGAWAYVMIKPAHPAVADGEAAQHRHFAVLVVDGGALRPGRIAARTDYAVVALMPDGRPAGVLFDKPASEPVRANERLLLPTLRFDAPDYSSSQPVQLRLGRQMRWADASVDALVGVAVAAATALVLTRLYVRRHYRDALHEREAYDEALHSALHDALTALANRSLLTDRIRQALAQWFRRREPFALFFIDLDCFKDINDRHGHEAGDAVLRAVAARLEAGVRELDTAARIAGDEFVVLVSGPATPAALQALADKLKELIAQPIRLPDGAEIRVSASLGISRCPDDGEDIDRLLDSADRAMYRYKHHA